MRATSGRDGRPRVSRAALAVATACALAFAAHAALFYGHLVDDAYITFRFADNLVAGHGIVWNRGEAPVEGYTNFSWLLLSALARAAGLAPHRAMLVVGSIAGTACVVACVVGARRFEREGRGGAPATASGLVAGLVAASFTGLALYSTTGLETPLHVLLFVVAALALVERRAVAFGALVGLAFLTRPEAGLLGIVGLGFFAFAPAPGRGRGRGLALAIAPMAALVIPYLVFKALYFGALFPNTLAAKEPSVARGLSYLAEDGWPAGFLVVAAWVGARVGGRREARELGMLSAIFVGAVALEGGDWMPAGRMLVPVVLWLGIAADATVRGWARLRAPRALSVAGLFLVVPWVGANAITTHDLVSTAADIERMNDARRALFTRLEAEGVRSIALVDIGLPGYLMPQVAITDLGGLVDPVIAHSSGGHLAKHPNPAYLAARQDEVYVLRSAGEEGESPPTPADYRFEVERHVAASDFFRERYRLRERIDGFRGGRAYVYQRASERRPR